MKFSMSRQTPSLSTLEILWTPEQRRRAIPIDMDGPDAVLDRNFWAVTGEDCYCSQMQGRPAGMAQSALACDYAC